MVQQLLRGAVLVLLTFCCNLIALNRAHAWAAEKYQVRAEWNSDSNELHVEEEVVLRRSGDETEIRLWVYLSRLLDAPTALSERTFRWIFPGEVSRAALNFDEVRIGDRDVAFALEDVAADSGGRPSGGQDLVIADSSGDGSVLVKLRFRVHLPDRFGRAGVAYDQCSLLAPWYPLVVDPGGGYLGEAEHQISMRASTGEILLSGNLVPSGEEVTYRGAYVPFAWNQRFRVERFAESNVNVLWHHFEDIYRPPQAGDSSEEGLGDFVEIDKVALIRQALRDVATTGRWLGLQIPENLRVVSMPSRTELASIAEDVVVVSDRIFEVIPFDVARDFHLRRLRRALFQWLILHPSNAVERASDLGWASELRATALVDLDERRRQNEAQRPDQLLSIFAFHPAVDQLLYAPQIAFENVYFASIDEVDYFRDDPFLARSANARGRRLLENARDALSQEQFDRFVAMLLHLRRPVRSALRLASPAAAERLTQWLAYPRLPVNYRLGRIQSRRVGDGFEHEVEVFRDGSIREERVEVEITTDQGETLIEVWQSEDPRGVVIFHSRGGIMRVAVDPRARLTQSPEVAEGHPRFDDATSHGWRPPILGQFAIDYLASEETFTGVIDFLLRPRYDTEHALAIRLARTVARTGGRIRYQHGFGPKVHDNRRVAFVGGGLGFNYVDPNFAGSQIGGWATDLEGVFSYSNVNYLYDPHTGDDLLVQLILTGTAREDSTFALSSRGLVRAFTLVPTGLWNTLFFGVNLGFTFGPALDADRPLLGGRFGLRGFSNTDLLGTGVAYGVAENRYTLIRDMAMNFFNIAWIRELQWVTWVGVGGVLEPLRSRDTVNLALEAGTGVRVHFEYGGIQPGVVSFDVGFPLSRYAGLNPTIDAKAPFAFYISFDQYY